jgi:V/A-type H+-transporting ATPase subunit E
MISMVTMDGNIEDLRLAIVSEARAEADELSKTAQSKAEAIRSRAQAEAQAARAEILENARQEAERLRAQAGASARLKSRSLELSEREKILDGVFAAAASKLASIGERKDYREIAAHLTREALTQLQVDKAVILADDHTRGLLDKQTVGDLSSELKVALSLGPALKQGRGVMVQTEDGHLKFDNTLETRLARMQNGLRAEVFRLLTGEGA